MWSIWEKSSHHYSGTNGKTYKLHFPALWWHERPRSYSNCYSSNNQFQPHDLGYADFISVMKKSWFLHEESLIQVDSIFLNTLPLKSHGWWKRMMLKSWIVFCCIVAWIQPDISGCQQDFLVVWRWYQLRTF